ncbi:MAG TPA: DoxX family protein [Candidatus Angelobacter sp.]|nr:DoxX family protein [Candidatus Angelobacter sp.]
MASGFSSWRGLAPHFLSVLRLMAGLLLLEYGTMKILHLPYAEYFANVAPFSLIWFAGLLELVGGALVAVGLFTRCAAFVLSGEMAFAYFIGHAPHGFYPALNEGIPAVLFCFVFLYLSAAGGGPWSLDRIIRKVG